MCPAKELYMTVCIRKSASKIGNWNWYMYCILRELRHENQACMIIDCACHAIVFNVPLIEEG